VIDVVIVADYKDFKAVTADVGRALRQSGAPARVIGGIAYEPRSAEQLRGEWSGRLDKSMFIRTARAIAASLVTTLPALAAGDEAVRPPAVPQAALPQPALPRPHRQPQPQPHPAGETPLAEPAPDGAPGRPAGR
jgi:hypothetical protein